MGKLQPIYKPKGHTPICYLIFAVADDILSFTRADQTSIAALKDILASYGWEAIANHSLSTKWFQGKYINPFMLWHHSSTSHEPSLKSSDLYREFLKKAAVGPSATVPTSVCGMINGCQTLWWQPLSPISSSLWKPLYLFERNFPQDLPTRVSVFIHNKLQNMPIPHLIPRDVLLWPSNPAAGLTSHHWECLGDCTLKKSYSFLVQNGVE